MKQTRERNNTQYYEGEICKKCQTSTRQVRDNRCIYCLVERQKIYNLKLREKNFMQTHGVSYVERDKMFIEQEGKCKICGHEGHVDFVPKGSRMFDRLVVDHCHQTGRVRGLLCNGCNRGLGYFKDNPENLENAIEYLTFGL